MNKKLLKILLFLFFAISLAVVFDAMSTKSFLMKDGSFSFFQDRLKAQLVTRKSEGGPELTNPYDMPINQKKIEITPSLLKCERNADCVLVETECCACSEGGSIDTVKAINKDLHHYFLTRMDSFCYRYFIDNSRACDPGKYTCAKKLYPLPVCRNNKCEAVPYEKNEIKRKALKDYSNDDSNDIGLSCKIEGRKGEVAKLNFWNLKLTASIEDPKGCEKFAYFWTINGKLPRIGDKDKVRWEQTTPQIDSTMFIQRDVKALCLSNNKIYGTAACKKELDASNSNVEIPFKNWEFGLWKCVNRKCVDDRDGLHVGWVYPTELECEMQCSFREEVLRGGRRVD